MVSAGADQRPYRPSIRRGIRVTTSAGANAEPVAITGVTGLLALARGFPHWWRSQQRHEWQPVLGAGQPPDLRGQTAVIVGMGHVGSVMARCLRPFGLKIVGVRRHVASAENFDEVQALSAIDSLLPRTDWLVLACPLGAETRGLIDARRLSLLPRTAGLVNMSRGEVVDESALTDALADGRLRCAYLDVFINEPLDPQSRLWELPNVLISPHNSASSPGNYARGVECFLRNLECYLRGAPLENEVALMR